MLQRLLTRTICRAPIMSMSTVARANFLTARSTTSLLSQTRLSTFRARTSFSRRTFSTTTAPAEPPATRYPKPLYERFVEENNSPQPNGFESKIPPDVLKELRAYEEEQLKNDNLREALAKYTEIKPLVRPGDPEDALLTEARKNYQAGNTAEAYTLSPNAGAIGSSGLFEKYGVFPLVASVVAIAISKEFWIMNEEVFVAATFGAFIASAIVTQGEAVAEMIDHDIAVIRHEQEKWYDVAIDAVDSSIKSLEQHVILTERMSELFDLYDQVVQNYLSSRTRVYRKIVNEILLQRLEKLKTLETDMLQNFVQKIADDSAKYVQEQYASNPSLAQEFTSAAIETVVGLSSKSERIVDPSSKVLKEYLNKLAAHSRELSSQEMTIPESEYEKQTELYKQECKELVHDLLSAIGPLSNVPPDIHDKITRQLAALPQLPRKAKLVY